APDEAAAQRIAQAVERPAERAPALAEWTAMEAQSPLMGLVRAQWLVEFGRTDEALQVLAGIRQRVPDDPRVPYLEAMLHSKLERLPDAERSLRLLLGRAPDLLDLHYFLADILGKLGKHEDAA